MNNVYRADINFVSIFTYHFVHVCVSVKNYHLEICVLGRNIC